VADGVYAFRHGGHKADERSDERSPFLPTGVRREVLLGPTDPRFRRVHLGAIGRQTVGPDLVAGQRGFHDRPLVIGRVVHDPIDAALAQASAQLRQEFGRHLLGEPGTQPRQHTSHRAHDGHIEQQLGGVARRRCVHGCRLAAQKPPQPRQDILSNLALVHGDRYAPELALLLHLLQHLGKRTLGLRLGADEPLARPPAPEAQPVQRAPGGRGGEGLAKGAFDEGRDHRPRPGAGLESFMARRPLDDGLQLHERCGSEPGTRLPTKPGVQPG
jgi:hypothetical protein